MRPAILIKYADAREGTGLTPVSVAFCLLTLGLALTGCGGTGSPVRPNLYGPIGTSSLEAPPCGARIFVAMGVNQKYPDRENMRVPLGDLYLDGNFIDRVSKNPEVTILDVPAGTTRLSWVPSSYDARARSATRQNALTLTLSDKQTAFVVLDWYDDTPVAPGLSFASISDVYRTEVVETQNKSAFMGRHIVFHRFLDTPCVQSITTTAASPPEPQQQASALEPPPAVQQAAAPAAAAPPQTAPLAPPQMAASAVVKPPQFVAPAPQQATPPETSQATSQATVPAVELRQAVTPTPEPQPAAPPALPPPTPEPKQAALSSPPAAPTPADSQKADPDVSEAFIASAQIYYIVNARYGAPAFRTPSAEEAPIYTFADATQLNVIGVSDDKRWLTVLIPGGKTAFVSTSVVTSGMRAPK